MSKLLKLRVKREDPIDTNDISGLIYVLEIPVETETFVSVSRPPLL